MAVLLMLSAGLPVAAASLISDPNLEKLIKEELWIPEEQELSSEDLSDLRNLYGNEEGNEIESLSGLGNATLLHDLSLPNNSISDLSPLQNLEHVYWLDLRGNNISDISSLSNIINGNFSGGLDLSSNQVTDITTLQGLTEIYELNLSQ